jgi:molybdopterin converting factor small subunit
MTASSGTHIALFGQLAEKVGMHNMQIPNVADTDALLTELRKRHPALADAPVIIAVNRRTVTENTPLQPGDSVALMPPFSGG